MKMPHKCQRKDFCQAVWWVASYFIHSLAQIFGILLFPFTGEEKVRLNNLLKITVSTSLSFMYLCNDCRFYMDMDKREALFVLTSYSHTNTLWRKLTQLRVILGAALMWLLKNLLFMVFSCFRMWGGGGREWKVTGR